MKVSMFSHKKDEMKVYKKENEYKLKYKNKYVGFNQEDSYRNKQSNENN